MRGIIVEGIDCAGKSTLIKRIKQKYKAHGGFDVKELDHVECESQYERYLHEYATQNDVILHRSHISEAVFTEFFHRPCSFTGDELTVLDGIVNNDYLVIYASVERALFEERMDATKDNQVIGKGDYEAIVSLFDDKMKHIRHSSYCSNTMESLDRFSSTVVASYLDLSR